MVCTGFHGGNARDLQTTGLHADEACGREELEKSLLGLAGRGGGRYAAALSVPPLLTCGEDKTFLFHFHGSPEMLNWENLGFKGLPGWFLLPPLGDMRQKSVGFLMPYLTSPHLAAEEGKLKSQVGINMTEAMQRTDQRDKMKANALQPSQILKLDIVGWVQKWKLIRQGDNLPLIQRHTSRPV